MHSNSQTVNPKHVKGWIFDLYPSAYGEMTIWIIAENGERIRLTDMFRPRVYVSAKQDDLERLVSRFFNSKIIASWNFVYKYASATDIEKSKVLEVELKDCTNTSFFTREVLELGHYLRYQVHNCDLQGDQAYLFEHGIFPLALVEVESEDSGVNYNLLDSIESVNYPIPPLRIMKVQVDVAKKGKIANLGDPIDKIVVSQEERHIFIDTGDERDKLLQLVKAVKENDPDF